MTSRWPRIVALAGISGWLTIALITWAGARPLGHDESQYALSATEWLAGLPPRWFYLSQGMTLLAVPGVLMGGSEHALRVLPLLCGLGFVLSTYLVGRRSVGAASAAWALVVLAGSRNVVRMNTDLLSDMPAAALLIAALAVILGEVDREDGPRWRLVAAAPLLAAALYVRYGSAVPIAVIVGASFLVGARTLVRRPLPVVATAALFLVLLLPHFMHAQKLMGSPLGILLASREVPQQAHLFDGLLTYLTSNPFRYYGLLTPFVLVAGALAFTVRDKRRLLVWLVAVGTFVAMGLTTHGMLRYILVPVALLLVLGTDLFRRGLVALPVRPRQVIGAALVVTLATVWLLIAKRQFSADEYRRYRMRGTLTAVPIIRADARGEPCVVLGYHYTQLEWYSGCGAASTIDPAGAAVGHSRGQRVYVVRDFTPKWVPAPQPDFSEMPGRIHVLFALPGLEIARFDRGQAPQRKLSQPPQ